MSIIEEKILNEIVICIPQTNTSKSLDMQIGLRLIDCSRRLQKVAWHTELKGNIAVTKRIVNGNHNKKVKLATIVEGDPKVPFR